MCCDSFLELSRWAGSTDGSQNMFYGDILLIIHKLFPFLLLIWNTGKGCTDKLAAVCDMHITLHSYIGDGRVVRKVLGKTFSAVASY